MPASAGAHERPDPRAVLWAALGSAFVFSIAIVLPRLALPLLPLGALPLTLTRLRGSLGNALLAAALAAALVGSALTPGHGLLVVGVAAPGMVLAEAMARGRGMKRGTAWAMSLAAVELSLALLFAHERMAALALAPWDEMRSSSFLDGLRAAGFPSEQVQWWFDRATLLRGVMQVVYPAVFVVVGSSIALLHALVLRFYLARRDPGWLEGGEFENLRLPMALAAVFVTAGASVAMEPLRPVAYNVLLAVGFLYALQGVAVVAFYTRRLAAPPALRIAVLVLVLVNPWAPQVLALLGLFDLWFDFRRWAEVPE